MRALIRDNNNQVEEIEVSHLPPQRLIRPARVGAINEVNTPADSECVYMMKGYEGGVPIYYFYSYQRKPGL